MQTFDQSIFSLYQQGFVTLEEALRWASNVDEFKLKVQGISTTAEMARDEMAKQSGHRRRRHAGDHPVRWIGRARLHRRRSSCWRAASSRSKGVRARLARPRATPPTTSPRRIDAAAGERRPRRRAASRARTRGRRPTVKGAGGCASSASCMHMGIAEGHRRRSASARSSASSTSGRSSTTRHPEEAARPADARRTRASSVRLYQFLMRQGFSPAGGRRGAAEDSARPDGATIRTEQSIMRSREIRRSFLEYFQTTRPHHRAELVARARRRSDAALHQRRDEPVQGRVPRPREARLHARDDLAEVHARQRQAQRPRQRRPVAAPSHVLRDARQLLVRRLLQDGGDPVRLGAADDGLEAAGRPAAIRPSSRARPASRATTRRTRSGRSSCPPTRITELGLAENFWQMGDTGPCGRCSEIHYFRGAAHSLRRGAGGGTCRGIDCSCDRYVEIWNNVFMEFDRAGRRHAERRCRRRRSTPAWASSASPR